MNSIADISLESGMKLFAGLRVLHNIKSQFINKNNNMSENMQSGGFFSAERAKMVKLLAIVLVPLSAFIIMKTVSEFKNFNYIGRGDALQRQITVTGKGEVVEAPDIATFTFSVMEESMVVKEAQDRAAKKRNGAEDFLKSKGVGERDIKTLSYNIYPRYEYRKTSAADLPYYPPGERYLAGYEVSETIEVRVKEIDNVGEILSGIGEIGVSEVSGLSFTHDKIDELKKQARQEAIGNARDDASNLARALGVSLGRVVNFSESGNYPLPVYYKTAMMEVDGRGSGDIAPDISPGVNKITSQVTITYEIR